MRCKSCLKKSSSLSRCSGCKSVQYCSAECQRVDWKEGSHKTDCRRLKAESSKIKTAFGRVDESEIVHAILRAADEIDRGGGGGGGGARDRLISKVLLPSAAVAEELIAGDAKNDVWIYRKGGDWFVDVLAYFLDRSEEEGGDEDRCNLSLNVADQFLLRVVAECDGRRMLFAVDRSARDYLAVVRANLAAIREIMRDADEPTMDRLRLLFYGLHWMEVQGLVVAARAKINLEDYSSAAPLLDDADAALDRMSSTAFDSSADRKRVVAVKYRIDDFRLRSPIRRMESLNGRRERFLRCEEGAALEATMVLRELGMLQISSGDDVDGGRKKLIKSLNRMVRYHDSVKDHVSPDEDLSGFLTRLGEAYELCALHAMPGEAGKDAKDVVKMQTKALEFFRDAKRKDKVLEANIRLWNWNRNGRVYLRWSDGWRLNKNPQFSNRLSPDFPEVFSPSAMHIRLLAKKFEIAWDDQCRICEKPLSWDDADDDDVEILVGCKHSFHTACVNFYLEDNEKECPACRAAFCD